MNARDVVVANPGSLSWLGRAAAELAERGMLRSYFTPLALAPERSRLLRRLPPALREEAGRRGVPRGVASDQVTRFATGTELLSVAAGRCGLWESAFRRTMELRDLAFDRGTSRRLRPDDRAAVLAWGSAHAGIRRASQLGVLSLLDYPVLHHDAMAALQQEEARLVPRYAPTLQFHALPSAWRRRLDEELRSADRILTLSTFQRRAFVERGVDPSKLVANPFGVDLEHFAPPPRPPAGPFRVLFAGQMSQRKGLSYLIEGFRRAAIPGSELVLVGHVINRSRPWMGEPGVRYAGPVAPAKLREHYAEAHVFVLPSLVEGLARVVLEAMACGLPTITTENAGATDVITDGEDGFIVPIRDPSAIADRLRLLHEDGATRERVGAAARGRAEQFSWRSYGSRLAAAIDGSTV